MRKIIARSDSPNKVKKYCLQSRKIHFRTALFSLNLDLFLKNSWEKGYTCPTIIVLLYIAAFLSRLWARESPTPTFQDITEIQKIEQKYRSENKAKGLVAKSQFHDIICANQTMKNTIERAKKFSETDSTILIGAFTGASKKGKKGCLKSRITVQFF